MTQPRTLLPDILKGIAVILMIQVHLMQFLAAEEIFISLAGKISLFLGGPPAAPVFMAIMGFFLARSKKSSSQNFIRGIKLIGLGFLLNLGMNFHLLVNIFTGVVHQNPLPFILGVDILLLAGISILVITIIRRFFKSSIVPYVVLILLVALSGRYLPDYSGSQEWIRYLQAFFWGNSEWSYFPVLPWLAYPLTGFLFSILDEKYNLTGLTPKGQSYILVIGFIILTVTFRFGFTTSADLPGYYHHSLTFYFWILIFLVFWILILNFLFNKNNPTIVTGYFMWVGKRVTTFYVLQWLIIGNLTTIFYRSQGWPALVFWFFTTTIATSLLVAAWENFKRKSPTMNRNSHQSSI